MKFVPLGFRVLIQQQEAKKQTESGIIIPTQAQHKPNKGTIVAVGEGKVTENGLIPIKDVAVGDFVMYGAYGGLDIDVDGTTFVLLEADNIQGKWIED